jgi:lantibiotic biosynthesis protein
VSQDRDHLLALAGVIADDLARPPQAFVGSGRWRAQSLAKGAAGIAVMHIERARSGLADWDAARAWLVAAVSVPVSAADDAGLFTGAPAVAFALHTAGDGRYSGALGKLDDRVSTLAHGRAGKALARMDRKDLPSLAEFDLIYGLTGIGAYLLRRAPGSGALESVLRYLVRLAEPLRAEGQTLPGWWTAHDPSFTSSPAFAGGHANLGMAHGISVIFISRRVLVT